MDFQKTTTSNRKSTSEYGTSRTTETGDIQFRQYVGTDAVAPMRSTKATLNAHASDDLTVRANGFSGPLSFVTIDIIADARRRDGGIDQSQVEAYMPVEQAIALRDALDAAIARATA